MANPFRSSSAPVTPRVVRAAGINSLRVYRDHSACSSHSAPGISTPSQQFAGYFLQSDKIFNEFMAVLQEAKTIVTFEWKANKCQGKLVPISYPIDSATGQPVDPKALPRYLQNGDWKTPACFCSIRGDTRTTTLLPLELSTSPVRGAMCLVCSESECPYFVNLDELLQNHHKDILAVAGYIEATEAENDYIQDSTASGKKRKLNASNAQRIPTWKGIASGIKPPLEPPSSSKMRPTASNVEVVSTISELLSPDGIAREKFDRLFIICNLCARVLPKVGQSRHQCMIEMMSSDSELGEDTDRVLLK